MDPARSLHSVFTDLVGERGHADASGLAPDEVLAAGGHPDLPEGLVAEAVVNYADTAPFEVAEHLAPYVRANSAVPQTGAPAGEEPHWYDLLTTAPAVSGLAEGADALDGEAGALAGPGAAPDAGPAAGGIGADLDFGHGHRDPTGPPAPGEEPAADEAPSWSAATQPSFDPGVPDPGLGIDLRPLSGDDGGVAGDEPDEIDGL